MLQVFSDMLAAATLDRRPANARLRQEMEAADAAWLAQRRGRDLPAALRREAETAIPPSRRETSRPAPKPLSLSFGASAG